MIPTPNPDPHDSCHHRPTSLGDTFGGIGTSREYREEDSVIPKPAPDREPEREP